MNKQQTTERQECGMSGCHCSSISYDGIEGGGQWYCSKACMQGRGCNHIGCNCSDAMSADQSIKSSTASIPGSPTKPVPKQNPGHLVDHNPGKGSPATRREPDHR